MHVLKKIVGFLRFLVSEISTKRVLGSASALTYSTLLAIVPILAVVFAIARGFGYSRFIEVWFRSVLSSQPQAADVLIGFVNSYLVHARSGVILGMGLLFMLWTVLMLVNKVVQTFNDIWQVKRQRPVIRSFSEYLALLFLIPIIIVLLAGVGIHIASRVDTFDEYWLIGPVWRFVLGLLPYVLLSAIFVAMYMFMPNTKVRFRSAVLPAVLSAIAMLVLQQLYVNSQMWVSSYNAIYGSFAALPLFMLWVQFSWTICLFGAELTYTNQNLEDFAFQADAASMSHHQRLKLSAMLMGLICRRVIDEGHPYSALELKLATGIPVRIAHDLLYDLCRSGLLKEFYEDSEKHQEAVFVPCAPVDRISVGMLIDRLESVGNWTLDKVPAGFSEEAWAQADAIRNTYLENERELLLKDFFPSSQNATAAAAATLSESTPWAMGMRTT